MRQLLSYFFGVLLTLIFTGVASSKENVPSIKILSLESSGTYIVNPPIGVEPYPAEEEDILFSGSAISAVGGKMTYRDCYQKDHEFQSSRTKPLLHIKDTCHRNNREESKSPIVRSGGKFALYQHKSRLNTPSEKDFTEIFNNSVQNYALMSGEAITYRRQNQVAVAASLSGAGLVASYVGGNGANKSVIENKYEVAINKVKRTGEVERVFEAENPFVIITDNGTTYEVESYFVEIYKKPLTDRVGKKILILRDQSRFSIIKDLIDTDEMSAALIKKVRAALAKKGHSSAAQSNIWTEDDELALISYQRYRGLNGDLGLLTLETLGLLGIEP